MQNNSTPMITVGPVLSVDDKPRDRFIAAIPDLDTNVSPLVQAKALGINPSEFQRLWRKYATNKPYPSRKIGKGTHLEKWLKDNYPQYTDLKYESALPLEVLALFKQSQSEFLPEVIVEFNKQKAIRPFLSANQFFKEKGLRAKHRRVFRNYQHHLLTTKGVLHENLSKSGKTLHDYCTDLSNGDTGMTVKQLKRIMTQ